MINIKYINCNKFISYLHLIFEKSKSKTKSKSLKKSKTKSVNKFKMPTLI